MTRRLRRLHLVLVVLVIAALAAILPLVRPAPRTDAAQPILPIP